MKIKNLIITKKHLALCIVSFTLLIAVLFLTSNFQVFANTISKTTTKQQETFTELYFENYSAVPTLLAYPNQYTWYKNPKTYLYQFSFTINNLENKNMVYDYEVHSFEHSKVIIDKGNVSLKSNESLTITEQFTLPSNYSRTKVTVNLINKNQYISFWMEEYNK